MLDLDGHISTINADGSNRSVIFQSDLPIFGMGTCPDGKQALFVKPTKQTKALNLYRLDIDGGRTTQLTNGKLDQSPVCSPDNKYFLYTSVVNGKKLLMRTSLEGGESRQMWDDFVEFAAISPDGQQIALLTVQGNGVQTRLVIKVIPANGGAPMKTFEPNQQISGTMQYSEDGRSVYYPINEKGVTNLVRQSLDGGPPAQVTSFKDLATYGYAYNWPDKKLAIIRGRVNSDVVVLTQQAGQ